MLFKRTKQIVGRFTLKNGVTIEARSFNYPKNEWDKTKNLIEDMKNTLREHFMNSNYIGSIRIGETLIRFEDISVAKITLE